MQIFAETDKRWLPDDAILWRYVPLRTIFFYLNGLIFLPSIEKLRKGDPFEGSWYESLSWFNNALEKQYAQHTADINKWISQELFSAGDRHRIKNDENPPNE